MRSVWSLIALLPLIGLSAGCGGDEDTTTGRIVFCNDAGAIIGSLVFPANSPPSKSQIREKLDSLVPALPKDGHGVRIAAAAMLNASEEFGESETLSEFEKSLTGSHRTYPCFEIRNEKRGVIVYRHDPGKWQGEAVLEQLRDPNHRSDVWRETVASEVIRGFNDRLK